MAEYTIMRFIADLFFIAFVISVLAMQRVMFEEKYKNCVSKKDVKKTFDKIHDLYNQFATNIDKELRDRKVNMSLGGKFHADLDKIEEEIYK